MQFPDETPEADRRPGIAPYEICLPPHRRKLVRRVLPHAVRIAVFPEPKWKRTTGCLTARFHSPWMANAFIDQAAAVILTSLAKARELGIPEHRMVHLHGCADAYDHWFISDRKNYHSSPAMRIVASETCEMAGMGIGEDDPRGLTVTGGLPYFGGGATITSPTRLRRAWIACARRRVQRRW